MARSVERSRGEVSPRCSIRNEYGRRVSMECFEILNFVLQHGTKILK